MKRQRPLQKPLEDLPRPPGVEVLREKNGTGADADQEQLGTDNDELNELEDDAEGG